MDAAIVVAPSAASDDRTEGQEETSVTMRRHTKSAGKFSSVSVATTSEAEEKALESVCMCAWDFAKSTESTVRNR